eukprot:6564870-Prymnesium_polylepis.1
MGLLIVVVAGTALGIVGVILLVLVIVFSALRLSLSSAAADSSSLFLRFVRETANRCDPDERDPDDRGPWPLPARARPARAFVVVIALVCVSHCCSSESRLAGRESLFSQVINLDWRLHSETRGFFCGALVTYR